MTHYWSPEGDHFKSREEIQQHVDKNQLSVDMAGFDAADINVRETEKQGETLFLWLFSTSCLFLPPENFTARDVN